VESIGLYSVSAQCRPLMLSAGAPNVEWADLLRSEPYMPSTAVSTRRAMAEYGMRPYHIRPFDMPIFGPTVRHGTRTNTAVHPYCTVTVDSPSPGFNPAYGQMGPS
jgi:hypothetical protein